MVIFQQGNCEIMKAIGKVIKVFFIIHYLLKKEKEKEKKKCTCPQNKFAYSGLVQQGSSHLSTCGFPVLSPMKDSLHRICPTLCACMRAHL